ncbi:hypothetical protein QBC40DRAFT_165944, partial [Triangularia verruculosa]
RPESDIPLAPDLPDNSSSLSPSVRHVSRQRTESFARSRYSRSQDTNRAVARVSRTTPGIPSSQKHSNAKWRTWLHRGGTSSLEAAGENQYSPDAQIRLGVSQRSQQNTDSSWTGLSEDLPPIPSHGEVTNPRSDSPPNHPSIHSSENTSEALDRYERRQRVVRGNQQYVSSSNSVDVSEAFTQNHDLNATDNFFEESMSGTDLDGRGVVMVPEGSSTESSSLNLTASSELDDGPSSSEKTANPHRNFWLNGSPSPQLSHDVVKRQSVMQYLEIDEVWRSFVFGDDNSDEVNDLAYTQASRDAARELQPSEYSASSDTKEPSQMEHSSTRATGCPLNTVGRSQASGSIEPWSSSDVPSVGVNASSGFIESDAGIISSQLGESVGDPSRSHSGKDHSDSTYCEPGSEAPVNRALAVSQESRYNDSVSTGSFCESSHREPCKAHAQYVGSSGSGSLSASADMSSIPASTLAPPRLAVGVTNQSGVPGVEEQVRFAPPKLFVGSRSRPLERSKPPAPRKAVAKRRGRPKKRAIDGRADIRGIPNYTSDPIEDFEDQQPGENSLFPALELF